MTPLQNKLRSTVYTMQRHYGVPVEVFTPSGETFDVETGKKTQQKSRLYVRRALVFRYREDTNFTYSIQYLRANSNFAQGGFYQLKDRVVAITNKDLGDFIISENSYIVYSNQRYSIITSQMNEEEGAILLKVREVQGQKPNRQVSLTVGNSTRVEGDFDRS